jgi:hypothetical protein
MGPIQVVVGHTLKHWTLEEGWGHFPPKLGCLILDES